MLDAIRAKTVGLTRSAEHTAQARARPADIRPRIQRAATTVARAIAHSSLRRADSSDTEDLERAVVAHRTAVA